MLEKYDTRYDSLKNICIYIILTNYWKEHFEFFALFNNQVKFNYDFVYENAKVLNNEPNFPEREYYA